jgi:uncharacterized protein (DUF305 family)
MKIRPLLIAMALATASAAGGLAQSGPAAKGFMDAMNNMMQAMHMQPTGDADKDFAAMMIPHHQGAIDMAKVELEYGKDPQLRMLAESVVAAQEKEIAELKEWQIKNP